MQRNLTKSILFDSVKETVSSCAVLFIIIIGATMLTRFLSISGTGAFISNAVQGAELGYWQIFLIIVGIYLILGMFMDPLGAMLLTLPIFIPIVETRGLDLIWFGVLLTKLLEIGMVTPPFGLNVFVIKSVVGNLTSLAGVFRGVAVFLLADIVVVLMVLQWHDFVMAIPRLASGN